MARTALRGRLIDFAGDPGHSTSAVRVVDDGLLLIDDGHNVARGEYASVASALGRDEQVTDFSGCLLMPGFVDAHTHFPQLDVIASPAGGLLDWLTQHTYPAEARFAGALSRAGALDGLSIGYRTARARRQGRLRVLSAVELWEVSLVTFPMLPGARFSLA